MTATMKKIYFIIALSAAVLSAASCTKEQYGAPDKDKYVYDIPQTDLDKDAVLGCYYVNYNTEVSSSTSPEVPLLGYYKTADAGVLEQHIDWADSAGVDFFIFGWDKASSDTALVNSFIDARSEETGVKFAFCYNTSHLKVTNDSPLESENNYKKFIAEFVDVLAGYMLDDSYYRIDGKPVLLVTPANLSSDALLSIDFSKVIGQLRNDFKSFYGLDLYVIGQITTGWVAPVNYADHQIYSFDAVVPNTWKTRSYDLFYSYFSFLDINWNNWKTTLAKRNVDFVPCVYPSFNDRVYDKKSYYYTFGDNGELDDYIDFCNVAKRNIGSHNLVIINSWNDWKYGTNLEPSDLKEGRFLDETRAQFKLSE